MAAPTDVIWALDDHTRAKHVILRKYLDAWLPIVTAYSKQGVLLVDGFAGPGEYIGGAKGSPLIMIEAFLTHHDSNLRERPVHFLFIEAQEKRCAHLAHLIAEWKRSHSFPRLMTYEQYQGRFVDAMNELLQKLRNGSLSYDAMFLFIDPFGYSHAPMMLIGELMQYPKCEVLITVMAEEINRFLAADYRTKDQHYDDLFGTTEWRKIMADAPQPRERLLRQHNLYRQQLLTVGGAKYVRSFRMRNIHNATDYYLFFGTKNRKGLREMKRAMWQVDPTGAYDFSDFSNPHQELLLKGPNTNDLCRLLKQEFLCRTVSFEEIEEYVDAETGYITCKEALKQMEERKELVVRSAPPGRKRGTFADPTIRIHFPETVTQASFW